MTSLENVREGLEPAAQHALDVCAEAAAPVPLPVDIAAHVATLSLAISAKRIADLLESTLDYSHDRHYPAIRTARQ